MVYPIVVFPAKHYNDAYHNMGYALRDDETGDFFCGFHYPEGYGHGLCRQERGEFNRVAQNSRPGHMQFLSLPEMERQGLAAAAFATFYDAVSCGIPKHELDRCSVIRVKKDLTQAWSDAALAAFPKDLVFDRIPPLTAGFASAKACAAGTFDGYPTFSRSMTEAGMKIARAIGLVRQP